MGKRHVPYSGVWINGIHFYRTPKYAPSVVIMIQVVGIVSFKIIVITYEALAATQMQTKEEVVPGC